MAIETIRWKENRVELIDQRLLPHKLVYVKCHTEKDMYDAIKKMKIRGAPAIGIAAAYGMYLGARKSRATGYNDFLIDVNKVSLYLKSSRPTAVNLFWAIDRVTDAIKGEKHASVNFLKKLILREANTILKEDKEACRAIGKNGMKLIKRKMKVITHCNAGALATADYGTALGVIYSSRKNIEEVYVDETRPRLQGARLTSWELMREGIKSVLICDNMAASIMEKGGIGAVIVGADRIAANGDTANKIGTYNLAIAARYHSIPFYVAAPSSTFDLSISSGKTIEIENRDSGEVKNIGREKITLGKMKTANPAFDITPSSLISAIITEKGIIRNPDKKSIERALKNPE